MSKLTTQYLISCNYGEYDDARSVPVLVVPEYALARDIAQKMETDPQGAYRQTALDALGDSVLPADADFSIRTISALKEELPLLTKSELRQKLLCRAKMEDLFDFRSGQECDIFKAEEFTSGDKIIYIPDLSLNEIPTDRPVNADELDDILSSCYTGNDFVKECHGNQSLAFRLFVYCDWQHPSSALPEIEDDDES